MNTQSRMNEGGAHVLEHVKQAFEKDKSSHAESLLICLGGLAGYACQVSARNATALPLRDGPFSVWAFIGNAAHKLGEPLPDLDEIVAHVIRTLGTSDFGVPRLPDGHKPRRPLLATVRNLWPQIQPIAQRYCDKPMQLPMVFGIAIQRALQQSKDAINPTVGARIAMECAVAMSKATLPAPAPAASANPAPAATRTPGALPADFRFTSSAKRREAAETQRPPARAASGNNSRLPFQRTTAVIALALIGVGGALWSAHLKQSETAAGPLQAQQQDLRDGQPLAREPQEHTGQTLEPKTPDEAQRYD